MIKVNVLKSYKLENGDVSGMFKIPADQVNNHVRHELIDLEGVDAELSLPTPDSPATDTEQEPLHIRAIRAYRELGDLINELNEKNERMEATPAELSQEPEVAIEPGLFESHVMEGAEEAGRIADEVL